MAFSWISVSVGTIAAASHVNEVKTNTDTLAANLGIANYGWTEMPVVSGDFMDVIQIQELQDALDYIDTNNTCSSENISKDTTVDGVDDAAVNATDNTTVDSGDDVAVDVGDHVAVDVGENATYDSDQNLTINTDQNTSVLNDQHGTYDSNQNLTINSDKNTTVYTAYNSGVG